ncbi:MAG: 23S rRNA (uracil(1939)-C(5))-methyltransferase RlmD [Rhodocyclaceae bacterium]|nr:23S rRNA (uracil(1939)-C(5))-methyltransferase RlmD [Rhodocyclaceae bacterium]MBX3669196.1 23S rRNA (uracil(1939)-C(5))-methyltransferase RlmD [Rhodocyclaceae bacterium]
MNYIDIESVDHEGRGIGRVEGKVVFVEGALPGERIVPNVYRRKPSYELARVANFVRESSQRVTPACPHFGVCGGCSMQHAAPGAQAAIKQRVLEDAFWHIGRLRPDTIFPPILGPDWAYRMRARLTARNVPKKGGVLVGFHERGSSYVADMQSCRILPRAVSDLLLPLRALVGSLARPDRLPQIELACGDDATVLVFRHLEPLSDADRGALTQFGRQHGVKIWLQPGGPDSARPLAEGDEELYYTIPDFGLRFEFRPTEFTQVNFAVNRMLVRRAVRLLEAAPGQRVLDLFCGLGNFTLPIARSGADVLGIEGSAGLVARANANAARNGLAGRASFASANLFEVDAAQLAAWGRFDKWFVDPPREGALAAVKALQPHPGMRIVYVSCNPATLARDAAVLVHEKSMRLLGAGIANMFPHTSHVESIALFEAP